MRIRPFLLLLVVPAIAAGCGPAPGSERSALSRQEYIARADAICSAMLTDSKSLRGRSPSEEQMKQVVALQGSMIEQLHRLRPPPGDERAVREVLRHLERLQAATNALVETEGEEVLGAVAAIAVEMDAVDQASRRYGLFRGCPAFRVSPQLHKLIHEPRPKPRPLAPTPRPRQTSDLDVTARALIPRGRHVLAQQNCAGGGRGFCVTISLQPIRASAALRRAAFIRQALRHGWQEIPPDDGAQGGVVVLRRGDRDAVVWIASPRCREGAGDSGAATHRCVDTIMLHGRL